MYYTYICHCGEEQEVNHGMNESPKIICMCGNLMRIKITMGGGVIFKGDGYTQTSLK